jgi:carbon storage regulator
MATGNGQLHPTNVMDGPVAANDIMEESIMLVLSRKVGESILISESIRVTVVQAANGHIRLGIDAPPEVRVLREELTKSCFNSSPSKNGKADALHTSAQLNMHNPQPLDGLAKLFADVLLVQPEVIVLREELTKSCSNTLPSKNGKAEALLPSTQLP